MELNLAILAFLKANAVDVNERLHLLSEEYRLRFGRPALMDNHLRENNPIELVWALDQALSLGDPNYTAYLYRGQQSAQEFG